MVLSPAVVKFVGNVVQKVGKFFKNVFGWYRGTLHDPELGANIHVNAAYITEA